MQDRFRFRVWHKPLKQMHYNDFVITATGYTAKIFQQCDYMMKFNQADMEFDKQCAVMQCTGLKDKNGKLIYEGDILRSDKYPFSTLELDIPEAEKVKDNYYAQVCWCNEGAQFFYWVFKNKNSEVVGRATGNTGTFDEMDDFEVIGNIYENPELLNEGPT